MKFLMAILESVGPDVQIHSLNKTLGIPFCCKPQTFEGDGAPLYVARLSIIDEELPKEIGVERTFNWLSLNIESLVNIPGRLIGYRERIKIRRRIWIRGNSRRRIGVVDFSRL
jgi:hypothetical protein